MPPGGVIKDGLLAVMAALVAGHDNSRGSALRRAAPTDERPRTATHAGAP